MTPFSTSLLAELSAYRTALLVYWANIFLLGAALYVSWICATATGLVRNDLPAGVPVAVKRRILIAQSWYALGALLSLFDTRWSIGFIVTVQLYYAVAPRLPWPREQG